MQIVDINTAIVMASTMAFLAAYDIKDKNTAHNVSEAFIGFVDKWYTDNGKSMDFENEVMCDEAVLAAACGIAQAHEMAVTVSKMMSFGK